MSEEDGTGGMIWGVAFICSISEERAQAETLLSLAILHASIQIIFVFSPGSLNCMSSVSTMIPKKSIILCCLQHRFSLVYNEPLAYQYVYQSLCVLFGLLLGLFQDESSM